jgi:hypothetical protein
MWLSSNETEVSTVVHNHLVVTRLKGSEEIITKQPYPFIYLFQGLTMRSVAYNTASNDGMFNGLDTMWKKAVVAYLKSLPHHSLGGTEENHKNLSQDSQSPGLITITLSKRRSGEALFCCKIKTMAVYKIGNNVLENCVDSTGTTHFVSCCPSIRLQSVIQSLSH